MAGRAARAVAYLTAHPEVLISDVHRTEAALLVRAARAMASPPSTTALAAAITWTSAPGKALGAKLLNRSAMPYANEWAGDPREPAPWAHAVCAGTAMPPLVAPPAGVVGYALTHPPLWTSDFGRVTLSNATYRNRVRAALTAANSATPKNYDLIGEYLLARQVLGDPPSNADMSVFTALYDLAGWSAPMVEILTNVLGYHPYLVGGILFALRGD